MKHIFLIGLRGSGKSSIGKDLASLLNRDFIDLDQYLMARENMSVAEIVGKYGWQYFRELEKKCLKEACGRIKEGGVIATGGGLPLDSENRDFMRKYGLAFWLTASPEALALRLTAKPEPGQRPAFSDKGLLEEMRDLAWQRFPYYLDSAHYIINGEKEIREICQLIKNIIYTES